MWGRRAFLDEVLAKVSMSKELTFAGIAKVSDSFHDADIDWNGLFSSTSRLDVFFSYGHTWRGTHSAKLRDLASKSGAKIRVVLPDPDNAMVVGELARRFSMTPERVRDYIVEAEEDFSALRERGAQVEIFFLPMAPLFTFYRFENEAVLAFHNHRLGRNPVPTFIVRRGGTLWSYLKEEFHGMIDTEFARRAT
jgi:hypothetical protein